jgi:hypothetical protein
MQLLAVSRFFIRGRVGPRQMIGAFEYIVAPLKKRMNRPIDQNGRLVDPSTLPRARG